MRKSAFSFLNSSLPTSLALKIFSPRTFRVPCLSPQICPFCANLFHLTSLAWTLCHLTSPSWSPSHLTFLFLNFSLLICPSSSPSTSLSCQTLSLWIYLALNLSHQTCRASWKLFCPPPPHQNCPSFSPRKMQVARLVSSHEGWSYFCPSSAPGKRLVERQASFSGQRQKNSCLSSPPP